MTDEDQNVLSMADYKKERSMEILEKFLDNLNSSDQEIKNLHNKILNFSSETFPEGMVVIGLLEGEVTMSSSLETKETIQLLKDTLDLAESLETTSI